MRSSGMVCPLPEFGEIDAFREAEVLEAAAELVVRRDALQVGQQSEREESRGGAASGGRATPARCVLLWRGAVAWRRGNQK